jgi:predicted aspartyl protease
MPPSSRIALPTEVAWRERVRLDSVLRFSVVGILSSIFGLLLPGGCATAPAPGPAPVARARATPSQPGSVVPARVVAHFFLVESRQDDGRVRTFLVDTGSTATLVSAEFADGVADRPRRKSRVPVRVRGAHGGEAEFDSVTLRKLWLGDTAFPNVSALIYNLSELSNHLGVPLDGVIGFPLFRQSLVTLDYPGGRLVIAPRPAAPITPPSSAHSSTLTYNVEKGTPLIPVQMGNESFVALIDTGSDSTLTLNPAGLRPQFVNGPRPGGLVGSLAGDRQMFVGRLGQNILIGDLLIAQPVIDLTDQLSSLGGEILRNFRLTFDCSRNLVTFQRESTAPVQIEPRRSSGLSFFRQPAYWRVLGVVPDTPAANLPVQAGDLCVRINGEAVSRWTQERFQNLLRTSARITFTMLEGSYEHDLEVPVIDLVP